MNVIRFRVGVGEHWLQVVVINDEKFFAPRCVEVVDLFASAALSKIYHLFDAIGHDTENTYAVDIALQNAMDQWNAYRFERNIPLETLPQDLGRTLVRVGTDHWQWRDGTPAPAVVDKRPADIYSFRSCELDGKTYCEVPLTIAHRDRGWLGWITHGVARRWYRQVRSTQPAENATPSGEPTASKRALPMIALVPIVEWMDRTKEMCIGAKWPPECNDEILEKVRSLG